MHAATDGDERGYGYSIAPYGTAYRSALPLPGSVALPGARAAFDIRSIFCFSNEAGALGECGRAPPPPYHA